MSAPLDFPDWVPAQIPLSVTRTLFATPPGGAVMPVAADTLDVSEYSRLVIDLTVSGLGGSGLGTVGMSWYDSSGNITSSETVPFLYGADSRFVTFGAHIVHEIITDNVKVTVEPGASPGNPVSLVVSGTSRPLTVATTPNPLPTRWPRIAYEPIIPIDAPSPRIYQIAGPVSNGGQVAYAGQSGSQCYAWIWDGTNTVPQVPLAAIDGKLQDIPSVNVPAPASCLAVAMDNHNTSVNGGFSVVAI